MKLREFYEFAKKVSDKNDILSSYVQFKIEQDVLNKLVDEFNKQFHQDLCHMNYGWNITLDDESILPFLESKGFDGTSWEVCDLVKNEFFANLEVVGFEADDCYDCCYTTLKMSDELFEEYRKYFVYVDAHNMV